MNRIAVSSSNLVSVGYDDATSTLEVEFHSGQVYQYFDVPRVEYDGLMRAGSLGSYFAARMRNSYRYARV